MEKESLIHYLSDQMQKIDDDDFHLQSWKSSTVKVLDSAMGPGNPYSNEINDLEYEETISYEELYPKKVKDKPASAARFRAALREIIDQIRASDLSEQLKSGTEVASKIIEALKFHLKGSQLEMIKEASKSNDPEKRKSEMINIIEKIDHETLHKILCDILSETAVGTKL